LLRDTERAALVDLDEDRLIALHARVRNARNKYSKLYRRRASTQVTKDASRGRAHATQVRAAIKAEAFEDALARVSRQLARAAASAASRLKGERLVAARKEKAAAKPTAKRSRARATTKRAAPTTKQQLRTPARKRASAQARAATRRAEGARGRR
jgi:hypothetical protein